MLKWKKGMGKGDFKERIVKLTARTFLAGRLVETEGILCVFRGLHKDEMREKGRCSDGKDLFEVAYIKNRRRSR
jgi:hypothetical protein